MGLEVVKTIQVLLACYNGARYLPQQLASLQAQEDAAFTILMQDDGSTDETMQLLETIHQQDGRFQVA